MEKPRGRKSSVRADIRRVNQKQMTHIHKRYVATYQKIFEGMDLSNLAKKYRDIETNYWRFMKPVLKAHRNDLNTGLDFGCGIGGCCVIGKLMGVDIIGVDIPTNEGKESPYVPIQKKLQKMGHRILLKDTTIYPWDFGTDQFDFLILYFVLNKEFMHVDRKMDLQLRLSEFVRITKPGGKWYVWPKAHWRNLLQKQPEFDPEYSIRIEFGP